MPGHFWDGIVRSDLVPNPDALARRFRLFEAADRYDWPRLFELLDDGQEKTLNMVCPDAPSWYSLLHHAARGNAPLGVVQQLLSRGHLRSLRCAAGERPVDLARRLGHEAMIPWLEPVVKHRPGDALGELEHQLHELIRREVSPSRLPRLPSLELLLELDDPMMTFLVPYMGGGFNYRLQRVAFPYGFSTGEDWLLLTRHCISTFQGSEARYVITARGSLLMAEPIID